MFLLVTIVMAKAVQAATPQIAGTYKYTGISCNDVSDLTTTARQNSENSQFGQLHGLLQFSNDRVIAKTRRFAFEEYGNDHCISITSRKISGDKGGEIRFEFLNSENTPIGKFGYRACRRAIPYKDVFQLKPNVRGNRLYLQGNHKSEQFCRRGPYYFVYEKTQSFELNNVERAKIGKEEAGHLAKIASDGKSEGHLESYVVFLLREERTEDAKTQLSKLRSSSSSANFVKTAEQLIVAYQKDTDDQRRYKALLAGAAKLADESIRKNVKEFEALVGSIPATSSEDVLGTGQLADELYVKYDLKNVAAGQYIPTYREIKATNKVDGLPQAAKDFPNSPFVADQVIKQMLMKPDFDEADRLLQEAIKKYPSQINLKITANYLPRFRETKSKMERSELELKLLQEQLALSEAIRKNKK